MRRFRPFAGRAEPTGPADSGHSPTPPLIVPIDNLW